MLGRAELSDRLNGAAAQWVFQLFAEDHGMGWDRTLLLDRAATAQDFVIKLLRHITGDDRGIDLALLQSLPALAVAAAEQDFLKVGFRVGLFVAGLQEIHLDHPADRRDESRGGNRAGKADGF